MSKCPPNGTQKLEENDWNASRTAEAIELERSNLQNLLGSELDLDTSERSQNLFHLFVEGKLTFVHVKL